MPVLYGVGVGPGDPELLTIKAIRVIESVQVVACPVAQLDNEGYALKIVTDVLKPDQTVIKLHFPMIRDLTERIKKRRAAALLLVEHLADGKDVAFITEGDPLLHSTFGYILEHLPEDIQIEVIPGVSSIMAASADAKMPLVQANETLAVIPMTRDNIAELEQVLQNFDTIVLMKAYRALDQIIALLDKLDLLEKAILVERASHVERRVINNLRALNGRQVHYLSLLIVHAGGNSNDS